MLLDQVFDFGNLRAIHRREVVPVVDVKAPLGKLQHFREERRVGAAAVEVILAAAEVVEAGGHAALGRGPALAHRIVGERGVDAGVHVRVDDARKREVALAVVDRFRLTRGKTRVKLGELAAGDGDVNVLDRLGVRPHYAHVLDEEVVLLTRFGQGASPGGRATRRRAPFPSGERGSARTAGFHQW